MIRMPLTLASWETSEFERTFKEEAATIDPALLPLQQGLSHSTHALAEGLEFVLLDAREEEGRLRIRAGIFYRGIVAGCSCADDPTPIEPVTEYCEVLLRIHRPDGRTEIELL